MNPDSKTCLARNWAEVVKNPGPIAAARIAPPSNSLMARCRPGNSGPASHADAGPAQHADTAPCRFEWLCRFLTLIFY